METQKADRRVKYTKALLKESLVRLMQTKPISKISVKMLCEDADINRSTFYAHFSNQQDLLRWVEQGVISDVNQYLSDHPMSGQSEETILIMKQILDYTAKNADLFQVLLSDHGDTEFQRDLMSIAQKQLISNLRNDRSLDERTSAYLQAFCIAGALTILQKWLRDGMVESSQEMAELISTLLSEGVSSYL